jgi:hypothetical protein
VSAQVEGELMAPGAVVTMGEHRVIKGGGVRVVDEAEVVKELVAECAPPSVVGQGSVGGQKTPCRTAAGALGAHHRMTTISHGDALSQYNGCASTYSANTRPPQDVTFSEIVSSAGTLTQLTGSSIRPRSRRRARCLTSQRVYVVIPLYVCRGCQLDLNMPCRHASVMAD